MSDYMTPAEINVFIAERLYGWWIEDGEWVNGTPDATYFCTPECGHYLATYAAGANLTIYAPYHNESQAMAALRKLPYNYQVLRVCTATSKPIWYVKIWASKETISIGGDESEAAIISQAIVAAVMQE